MALAIPAFSMPPFSKRLPAARKIEVTVNNGTSAYTTGKTMGTVQTVSLSNVFPASLNGSLGIRIHKVLVLDTDEVGCDMDLHFWDSAIAGQADVATFAHASVAEAKGYCGKIAMATYIDISGVCKYVNNLLSDANSIFIPLQSSQFYMQAVAKASKTFTNASVVKAELEIEILF